jgi:hypothetical protein
MATSDYISQAIIIACLTFLIYILFFRQEKIAEIKPKKMEIETEIEMETEEIVEMDLSETMKAENGKFTDWGEWSSCDKPCGGGSKERKRNYIPAKFGGVELEDRDSVLERITCNEQRCPENGKFTNWEGWGDCNKPCGGGSKERKRNYIPAKFGGIELEDRDSVLERIACNEQGCPVDGFFTPSDDWGVCDKECGGGIQYRNRTYTPAINGGVDLADRDNTIESQSCNKTPCIIYQDTILPGMAYNNLELRSADGNVRFVFNSKRYALEKLVNKVWVFKWGGTSPSDNPYNSIWLNFEGTLIINYVDGVAWDSRFTHFTNAYVKVTSGGLELYRSNGAFVARFVSA